MAKIIAFDKPYRPHAEIAEGENSIVHEDTGLASAKVLRPVFPRATGRTGGGGPNPAALPTVSVVVPTCGRPYLLNRCIDALIQQDLPKASYEVLIVDDAPSDATRDLVERWAEQAARRGLQITYLASYGPHGPAAARNKGWHAARAGIVAFTDDDTVPDAAWLTNGLHAFEIAPDTHAVWGRIVMPVHGTPTDYERDAKGLETAEFVTANCFCRKPVLEALAGFDERFRLAWREDADFYFNLLEHNFRVRHVPQALVVHPVRPARWGVSMSQQKKVVFDVLLYKKHPLLYRQKIRPHARWDYYLIVASLLALLGGLAVQAVPLAVGGGALWLLMTLRFFAKRLCGTVKTPSHVAEMLLTSAVIPPLAVFWRLAGILKFKTLLA